MKQTKTLAIIAMAGALLATSCASKKELQNCQTENKELTGNYQAAKEQVHPSLGRGEEQERLTQHGAYQQPDPLIEQGRVEGSRRTGTQGCGLHIFGRQYALSEWKL